MTLVQVPGKKELFTRISCTFQKTAEWDNFPASATFLFPILNFPVTRLRELCETGPVLHMPSSPASQNGMETSSRHVLEAFHIIILSGGGRRRANLLSRSKVLGKEERESSWTSFDTHQPQRPCSYTGSSTLCPCSKVYCSTSVTEA